MAVFPISLINFSEQLLLIAGLWCSLPTKSKGNCRWLQVMVVLRSKCKDKYEEFTLLWPQLAFSSPLVQLKSQTGLFMSSIILCCSEGIWAQQSAYGELCFPAWGQESALGFQLCPLIGQCDSKGKIVLKLFSNYFSTVPQTHRLLCWSKLPYYQKLPRG